jgi:Bacterial TniB protein
MNQAEKLREFNKLYIAYPRFSALLKEIERIHMESKYKSEPLCMMITADTGAGKSTLIDKYKNKWLPEYDEEGVCIPVLVAEVPLPATISALLSALLNALGALNPSRGKVEDRRRRLIELLKRCQVQLIILDEFQHLIERGTPNKIANVADWIKSLINESGLPFLLVGVPSAKTLLHQSEQLARRFKIRRELCPLDYVKNPDEFTKLLKFFDSKLPFDYPAGLAEPKLALPIFLASKGVFGHLSTLLQEGCELASARQSVRLEKEDLADAFDAFLSETLQLRANPFRISRPEAEKWLTTLGDKR